MWTWISGFVDVATSCLSRTIFASPGRLFIPGQTGPVLQKGLSGRAGPVRFSKKAFRAGPVAEFFFELPSLVYAE